MKKLLALLAVLSISLVGFVSCGDNGDNGDNGGGTNIDGGNVDDGDNNDGDNNGGDNNGGSNDDGSNDGNNGGGNGGGGNDTQQENTGKKFLSTFDDYHACLIIPVSSWMGHIVEEGLIETEWNQEKEEYIKEGKGSCRFTTREDTSRYRANLMTNSELVPINDINGATKISLDVYNTQEKEIEVSIEVVCGTETVITTSKICTANKWTTVSADVPDATYAKVTKYTLTLENVTDKETFTVYLDNFYIQYAE